MRRSLVLALALLPAGLTAQAREVAVVSRDFAFQMPAELPGGLVRIRLRNEGRSIHHLMVYRLEGDRTMADVMALFQSPVAEPSWLHAVGGPNGVVPGGEVAVTLALPPGRYVAFCRIQDADKVAHVKKGMISQFTVTGPTHPPVELPRTTLTVTLSEYGFAFSRPPAAGRTRLTVTNAGRQTHELIMFRLAPGKTVEDFATWLDTKQNPPGTPAPGVTDLEPGRTAVLETTLEPGTYVVDCRVLDQGDVRPHDLHGMRQLLVIP